MGKALDNRIRIQNFIVDLVKKKEFPLLEVAEDGKLQKIVDAGSGEEVVETTETPILPILCDEVSSVFSEDESYGRKSRDTKVSWTFSLILRFNRRVSFDPIEDIFCVSTPFLAADIVEGLPSVILHLRSIEPEHPVYQQGNTGTKAKITFLAQVGRI